MLNVRDLIHLILYFLRIFDPSDDVFEDCFSFLEAFFSFSQVKTNFNKRDSLKREKASKRESFSAFRLVSQAERATFCGITL
jgi:hypothetical protein